MNGIFIPQEIMELPGITSTEMLIMSVYHYYTTNGNSGCCTLTNEQVAELTHSCVHSVKNCKSKFKSYLKVSGIKTWYKKCTTGTKNVPSNSTKNVPVGGTKNVPHNKEEIKRNKDNKEEVSSTLKNNPYLLPGNDFNFELFNKTSENTAALQKNKAQIIQAINSIKWTGNGVSVRDRILGKMENLTPTKKKVYREICNGYQKTPIITADVSGLNL